MQVKSVATALGIHPFMLSKWRKDVRDGTLRGRLPKAAPPRPDAGDCAAAGARENARAVARGARSPKRSDPVLRIPKAEAFAFVHAECGTYGVARLCPRLGVTRGGYYVWRARHVQGHESAHTAQDRTLRRRQPAPGTIFYSDLGAEYLPRPLLAFHVARGVRQSTNAAGPGDNVHMESFFDSPKAEAIRGQPFAADGELRQVLRDYITYNNRTSAHSALNCRSPIDFERAAT